MQFLSGIPILNPCNGLNLRLTMYNALRYPIANPKFHNASRELLNKKTPMD